MPDLTVTRHAQTRMRQRGLSARDLDLLLQVGLEVPDGYLGTRKGCEEISQRLKQIIRRLDRMPGKRLVVQGDTLVTTYHATARQQRRLKTRIEQRELVR